MTDWELQKIIFAELQKIAPESDPAAVDHLHGRIQHRWARR